MRLRAPLLFAIVFGLVAAAPALAQPMMPGMPDPSQMSGIPRPDPSVQPGRLTVRVLRGDFAHPMIGQEVILDGPGGEKRARVDQSDHAVFDGLTTARGSYTVRASAYGQTLTSQPIELPADMGVKIMLVFKPDEAALLGEHDGVARADKTLPPTAIAVSVHDVDDKPMAGVEVVLGHADKEGAGKGQVEEKTGKTDERGELRFEGKVGEGDAYLVAVKKEGLSGASQPFRLEGQSGVRVGLRGLAVTKNAKVLSIGKRSHLILEVKDEGVEVIENVALENQSTDPFDPGPSGVVFPLPDGAQGAQLAGEGQKGATVEGNKVVWRGTLPPGETALSFGFVLPLRDDGVHLVQTLPVEMQQFVAVTDRFEGMEVDGQGGALRKEARDMNGRNFYVVSGPPIPVGGTIDLRLSNLPHQPTTWRNAAVVVAALLLLWGLVRLLSPERLAAAGGASRPELLSQRDRLLDELLDLEATEEGADADKKAGKAGGGNGVKGRAKRERRRDEVVARLERIYRQLDDAAE